jgi:hypothetical protein
MAILCHLGQGCRQRPMSVAQLARELPQRRAQATFASFCSERRGRGIGTPG